MVGEGLLGLQTALPGKHVPKKVPKPVTGVAPYRCKKITDLIITVALFACKRYLQY